ncbi:response regulator transcription factor [Streptomyces sp. NPDC002588]|uniref:response regulator transcription factor n=1 Tax=Streptomyces sp. NPDC002588 TaxID=3154419 RepID=UPI003326F04A
MTGTPGFRGGRVRVLIVDEEPALTDVLSVAVTEAGRRPYPAPDGQSALREARRCAPHAVVLDGMLPDLDGIQVRRRPRHGNPGLPVLPLTARDALEYRTDDDLMLTPESREARRNGAPVTLTVTEFGPLGPLMEHPRQVPSRTRILDRVRSGSFDGGGNLVEVHISSLRRKLARGRAPLIHTVRGPRCAIRPVEDGR